MSDRQRHPRKDLEASLRIAEDHGWTFKRNKGYFLGMCSCGVHHRTVHLSPSDPRYKTNLDHWFRRQTCWNEGSS